MYKLKIFQSCPENENSNNGNESVVVYGQAVVQFIFNRFLTIILFTNKFVIITDNMITLALVQA